ncbi:MAG: hypothetical protein KDK61_05870, partial [Simkania sp.]|nr:hypothetical protein [Simkania sp.]
MVIKTTCPNCKKSFLAKEEQAGRKVACKYCKKPAVVSDNPEDLRVRVKCKKCDAVVVVKKGVKDAYCADCLKKAKVAKAKKSSSKNPTQPDEGVKSSSTRLKGTSSEEIEAEILKKHISSRDNTSQLRRKEVEEKQAK